MRTLTTYELDLDSTFNQAGDVYDYQERKGKIVSLQLGEVLEVQQLSDIRKKEFITSRKVKVVREAIEYTDKDKVRNNRWGYVGLEMVNGWTEDKNEGHGTCRDSRIFLANLKKIKKALDTYTILFVYLGINNKGNIWLSFTKRKTTETN